MSRRLGRCVSSGRDRSIRRRSSLLGAGPLRTTTTSDVDMIRMDSDSVTEVERWVVLERTATRSRKSSRETKCRFLPASSAVQQTSFVQVIREPILLCTSTRVHLTEDFLRLLFLLPA